MKIRNIVKETLEDRLKLFTNPKALYNEMIELGRKEGLPFMYYAIAVEVTEDVITPVVLAYTGYPEYIPLILAGHSEPVMYPLYFAVRRLYKKFF